MLAQFVLFDGFDPLDVIAPYEVFSAAGNFTDQVRAELVSAEGAREVPSGIPGVSLTAAALLDPGRADLIVVPGAAGTLPAGTDAPTGEPSGATIPVLIGNSLTTELPGLLAKALATPNTTVATVCGGSLVLAMAGLIKGRNAMTHHQGVDVLARNGVTVVHARVVDDGDLVTAGGVTSGLDLALHLLDREIGPKIALAVEHLFAHERRGVVWRDRRAVPQPGPFDAAQGTAGMPASASVSA
ncbi:glutamine amidotransferase [Streptomyces albus subsp. albus]|nr:glutamine amidotransferase [Streptomyces albus subsp. albus]